jgi:hypothetical protein
MADQMTAGELRGFCATRETTAQIACRFYILGAVEGAGAPWTPNVGTPFCLPGGTSQDVMVAIARRLIDELYVSHPQDMALPAVSVVVASMTRSYPCAPQRKNGI